MCIDTQRQPGASTGGACSSFHVIEDISLIAHKEFLFFSAAGEALETSQRLVAEADGRLMPDDVFAACCRCGCCLQRFETPLEKGCRIRVSNADIQASAKSKSNTDFHGREGVIRAIKVDGGAKKSLRPYQVSFVGTSEWIDFAPAELVRLVATARARPCVGNSVLVATETEFRVGTLLEDTLDTHPFRVSWRDGGTSDKLRTQQVILLDRSSESSLPDLAIGERVIRRGKSAATPQAEVGIVIGFCFAGFVLVRFPCAASPASTDAASGKSFQIRRIPAKDPIAEAAWPKKVALAWPKTTATDSAKQEVADNQQRYAVAREKYAVQAERLQRATERARIAELVTLVRFRSGGGRPTSRSDIEQHLTYEWAVQLRTAAGCDRPNVISVHDAAILSQAVMQADEHVPGKHVLAVRGDVPALVGESQLESSSEHGASLQCGEGEVAQGHDTRMDAVAPNASTEDFDGAKFIAMGVLEARRIRARILATAPAPSAVSSGDLLKAGVGVVKRVVLDDQVQDFFDGPKVGFKSVELESVPTDLNAVLRPYQHVGYSWLVRNARNGFGSLLADDMGLGKTVQVISFVLHLKQRGLLKKPALIIVPKSLLVNWEAEIQKFAPNLKVHTYHEFRELRPTRSMRKPRKHQANILVPSALGAASEDVPSPSSAKRQRLTIDGDGPGSASQDAPSPAPPDAKTGADLAPRFDEDIPADCAASSLRVNLSGEAARRLAPERDGSSSPEYIETPEKTQRAPSARQAEEQGSATKRPRGRPRKVPCGPPKKRGRPQICPRPAPPEKTAPVEEEARSSIDTADILLTTYGLCLKDEKKLASEEFSCIILDEAQHIKTYSCRTTMAVKRIAASAGTARIAMSGTPIENSLYDLHCIFDFILPGYLTSCRLDFEKEFIRPINAKQNEQSAQGSELLQANSACDVAVIGREGNADLAEEKRQLLQRLIKPFLMRRLKSDPDIVSELPDKIERIHMVELTPAQRLIYQEVADNELRAAAESKKKRSMCPIWRIFAMIHSLKQICNHPASVGERHRRDAWYELESKAPRECVEASNKCVVLQEILQGVLQAKEKALIFCGYLDMIDILREQIEARFKCKTSKMVGKLTSWERAVVVKRFQEDPEMSVLIMSHKTGGIGINLTSASHVIHFDRPFNPAVENQATDRTHRIGQFRTVMVHYIIAQDTFEERIDKIIKRKAVLSSAVLGQLKNWFSNFEHAELKAFFSLSGDTGRQASLELRARKAANEKVATKVDSDSEGEAIKLIKDDIMKQCDDDWEMMLEE
eukprot:TRINITY_DN13629_c1_g5_i1.p1 TRINITY_DN13629_c1_g5~~TRINITY_DN13629_c1_g5_i1.p1  ORF type:complete len:1282 (-),score=220.95 TRINITY_DN13629_c1_g5_i1:61-3906(-)